MRSLNKLSSSLALGGAAIVGLTSMVMAADGATISQRLGASMVVSPVNEAPTQSITADCTATCELWAKPGTINLAGIGVVPFWGFATSAAGEPTLPGPTIVVNSGDMVRITVHNQLPAIAGALGPEALGIPVGDRIGAFPSIANGGVGNLDFEANLVGTSLYGAGPNTPAGNRQWAMGLSGVLVVRPAECAVGVDTLGCAYGDPAFVPVSPDGPRNAGSALGYDVATDSFNGEALVVLNDIDPAFSANPMGYDITQFRPTAHLINGRLAPDTEVIDAQAGQNVLVRYANVGLSDHSMGLTGSHQRTIGRDAKALPYGSDDVTVPLNVAQTADVMVTVPLDAMASYRYLLSDQMRIPGAAEGNAAMTFIAVWGAQANPGLPTGDIWGLAAAGCNPQTTVCTDVTGSADLTFAGVINLPSGAAAANVARFSVDNPGADLNSTPGFPGAAVISGNAFQGVLPASELATLVNGNHVLWVQLSNDGGLTWGDPTGIAFTIDRAGPVVTPVTVEPAFTNGTEPIEVSATAQRRARRYTGG
jgi:FtsP/CotA-like multicopper oxidase with cupredoxin domain